jgi:hypothetical protein
MTPSSHDASYTYAFDVYRMLMRARRERSGHSLWRRYAIMTAIFLVITAYVTWNNGQLADIGEWSAAYWAEVAKIILLSWLGLMAFVTAVDAVFDRLLARWVFARHSMAGSDIDVKLSQDAIDWSGKNVSGKLTWDAVKDMTILKDKSAAVVWIGKIEGLVLPALAFKSAEAFDAAIAFIREHAHALKV